MSRAAIAPAPRRSGFGLRHLMYAIVWIALAMVVLRDYWRPILLFLVVVGPVAAVAGVIAALVARRGTQQEALLSVMAIAAERGMPLAPGIDAFAELCGGGFRLRARGLAYLLEAGVSFPEALANVPGLLPRRSVLLACVGWSQGRLGPALRDALAAESIRKTHRAAFLPKLAYLCALLLMMQTVGAFVLYFVAPKFEAIFLDFGVSLPTATIWTIRVGQSLGGLWLTPLLILVELTVLVSIPFASLGLIRWRPPGANWLLWRRDAAAILRALAVTVEARQPITTGMDLLAELFPVARIRRGLFRARVLVENGVPWFEALRRRHLIGGRDAGVLEAAQRAGNLAWALRALADSHDRQLGYRLQVLAQLIFPLIVLGVGVLVGLFAVGYFLPLIHLIQSLAG